MGELVIIPGRDPSRIAGGSESYAVAHGRAARTSGYAPHVVVAGPDAGVVETDFGVLHRVRTPIGYIRSVVSVLHAPWLVPAIVALLRDKPGPHVLHAYGVWSHIAVQAARRLEREGVEAIVVTTAFSTPMHENGAKLRSGVVRSSARWAAYEAADVAWSRLVATPLDRRGLRASRVVCVNYASVRAILDAAYGGGLPIREVPYTPATAFEPRVPGAPTPGLPPGDAPLVVSVSRHDPRKGLDLFLHALARMRDAGVAFRACLVGTGELLDAHRRLATALGLDDRVTLPGRVPAVMPYLDAADVFVLPSYEEGSGSVSVLEALQAGTAIVCSGIDGLVEDLTDGHDALLVPPSDAAALQAALTRLADDAVLRARLGAAGRATFERRFSPAAVAGALAELYTSLGLAPRGAVRAAAA